MDVDLHSSPFVDANTVTGSPMLSNLFNSTTLPMCFDFQNISIPSVLGHGTRVQFAGWSWEGWTSQRIFGPFQSTSIWAPGIRF